MRLLVTTSQHPDEEMLTQAAKWSKELACPIVPRSPTGSSHLGLQEIADNYHADLLVIIGRKRTTLWMAGKEFYYHPNMAKLRLLGLAKGQKDHLIEAAQLQAGDSFLDCTLGLAADAIVASYITGPNGQVVGLESAPLIARLTAEGLAKGTTQVNTPLSASMQRIQVINSDALIYLQKLPAGAFEVVYFDPMFSSTISKSSGLELLRLFGNTSPVNTELVAEAYRVAQQRVVIKQARGSTLFKQIGITHLVGGKYSSVIYGVLEKRGT